MKKIVFICLSLIWMIGLSPVITHAFMYPLIWPVGDGTLTGGDNYYVSQGFNTSYTDGFYNSYTGSWTYGHDGLDISGNGFDDCGEPVLAAADGTVVFADAVSGWGNMIRIQHTISGETLYTLYGHLESITVTSGTVVQGQEIGTIGNGGVSTGCHLHFGVLTQDIAGNGYYYGDDSDADGTPDILDAHRDPFQYLTGLVDRENAELLYLNPFSDQTAGETVLEKLGERDDPLYLWTGYSEVNYDSDGIPDDALVMDYSDEGAIFIHPDSQMAVEIDGNSLKVWEGDSPDSGVTLDSSCSSDGLLDDYGLPITGVYYVDNNNSWRQDFQKGYLYRDMDNETIYCASFPIAPGWTSSGWDSQISPAIIQAYERNGAAEMVGSAIAQVSVDASTYIQKFGGGENGDNAIVVPDPSDWDENSNPGSAIRGNFWAYFEDNGGLTEFGAPLADELNQDESPLRGYDPVCDTDDDGWVDQDEREDCIDDYCGSDDDFYSMQRFAHHVLCIEEDFLTADDIYVYDYEDDNPALHRTSYDDPDSGESEDSSGTSIDTDGDGITDDDEATLGTDSNDRDSDNDGYSDGFEITDGTDPMDSDTDDDGVMDGGDRCADTSPRNANDTVDSTGCSLSQLDSDSDDLDDYSETYTYGTNPNLADSDVDGLNDGEEISLSTDPLDSDSDGDGVLDGDDSYPRDSANWEVAVFTPSAGASDDYFGGAVSISGDVAVVGAYQADDLGTNSGTAYVYRRSGSTWALETELLADDGNENDRFGASVAGDGDVVVVGATQTQNSNAYDDSYNGSVYVFRYESGTWNQEAKLTPSDNLDSIYFGDRVVLQDDLLVVGAYTAGGTYSNQGKVYVYRYDGTSWHEEAILTASDFGSNNYFGSSLALDGDNLVVGADGHTHDSIRSGSVYVFTYDGTSWTEETELNPFDAATDDEFGDSVAISGNTLVVGANREENTNPGAVYVYNWDGDSWEYTTQLVSANGGEYDAFGNSVSLSENWLAAGAYVDEEFGALSGTVTLFSWNGVTWHEEVEFSSTDVYEGSTHDEFGYSVSLSGNDLLVGALQADGTATNSGRAYLYDLSTVSATSAEDLDTDGDGLNDSQEGNTYGTNPLQDDTDGDGVSDFDEVAVYSTDPNDTDSDDDGLSDADEVSNGTDPLVAQDTDGDGVIDVSDLCPTTAIINEYDTLNSEGCALSDMDSDGDGLTDYEESVSFSATYTTKLIASDGDANDSFGNSVGVSESVAVVGAYYYSADGYSLGSAYVYRKDGSSWDEEAILRASDGPDMVRLYSNPQYFGFSVSVSEDVALIGAYGDGEMGQYAGAAYVYRYDSAIESWNETKLTASDGEAGDLYGYAVSVSGDLAVVGVLFDKVDGASLGSTYVYRYNSVTQTWNEEAILRASDGYGGDYFGQSVSVKDDLILVGAPYASNAYGSGKGAAYVFRWDATTETWDTGTKLTASDGQAGDDFGRSVSISEDMAVVGAYGNDEKGEYAGAAYIYRFDGLDWDDETKLTASNGEAHDYFGKSVSVSGNLVFFGADHDDDEGVDAGAAYVSYWDGSAWTETKLTANDGEEGDLFGDSVFVSDNTAIIGEMYDDEKGVYAGAAYVYEMTVPTNTDPNDADSDDDGLLDGEDTEPTVPLDTDSDGVTGINDLCSSTSPLDSDDTVDANGCALSQSDADSDSLTDYQETITHGTNPNNSDTDGDGINDGDEIVNGYDPLNTDFVVTKTADTNDGTCDADCSLREAIRVANSNTSTTSLTIDFDIPSTDSGCDGDGVCTISPTSALPSLTRGSVTIDGYSQEGSSENSTDFPLGLNSSLKIVLNGSSITTTTNGLFISSSSNIIQGLVVDNFSQYGVYLSTTASGNAIRGCFIGTDATGMAALPNKATGIYNAGINTVIGTNGDGEGDTTERNLISGNLKNGIQVNNGGGVTIAGNIIGLNAPLTSALANGQNGILIVKGKNQIGSNLDGLSDDSEGNIIAYNTQRGIYLNTSNTIGNQIRRNSLYNNTSVGITLANTANNSKASPRITSKTRIDSTVTISGTATAGDSIELFVASSDNEGKTYLGTATADASGNWTVTTTSTDVPTSTKVVATATDTTNGTSAFSAAYTVR